MKERHSRTEPANDLDRSRICQEAARIMAEEGVRDFHAAKRRAASRLNLPEGRSLPSNQEVEQAFVQYLSLFQGRERRERGRRLRALALEAMRFLAPFEPRLVGGVLSGAVTAHSPIELQLAADTPEEVGFLLAAHHIPYDQFERRVRFGGDREERVTGYRFTADGVIVELTVLGRLQAREAPLSPVDGRPMRRAALREVEQLAGGEPAR
jgi:hypothetical protein